MNRHKITSFGFYSLLCLCLVMLSNSKTVFAQTSSNSNSSSNSSSSNNNNNGSGVVIDAQGVLNYAPKAAPDRQFVIDSLRALPQNVARRSEMRLISLNRLEQAIADSKGTITDEMRYMVGILRLKYVFFHEETGDIVVGGPAEGWTQGRDGAIVGASTGRPVLELEDMIVALRAYPPKSTHPNHRSEVVGCSIDPTREGLARMNDFVRSFRGLSPNPQESEHQKVHFMNGIRETLGYHDIRVDGVSPNTHLAQVLVAADYRMKLIGLGLERHNVRMVTYIDGATPTSMKGGGLIRWFFIPDYDCIKMTDDRYAMELVGDGVKLVEEAEMVSSLGERSVSKVGGSRNKASRNFVKSFTQEYPKIANAAPVYAQMRNVIDMLVCAAHIQKEDFYGKSDWNMEYFASEKDFPVETYPAAEKVASVVARIDGANGRFAAPVSGGVVIQSENALDKNLAKPAEKEALQEKAKSVVKLELAPGQWWWDAEVKSEAKSAKK